MEHEPTLYLNAVVHTMDDSAPCTGSSRSASAIFTQDGLIAAIGDQEYVERHAPRGVTRVDLNGLTVIPGFNDCHCHILSLGLALRSLDVSADAVATIEELKRAVAQRAGESAADTWVVGRGYDQNMLAEHRHPSRADLDEVAPNHPVVLYHTSGHVLTCNSRALILAGLTSSSATPPGGEIERDEHGELTGLLKESPAMDLVSHLIPLPDRNRAALAVEDAMRVMAGFGITSATDAATGHWGAFEPEVAAYQQAARGNNLAGRIGLLPQIMLVAPPDTDERYGPGDFDIDADPDWLMISGTKIFSDGALSTRTAALRQPYLGEPSNNGILLWESNALGDSMRRAHIAGWQIATHALGDRAVETVVQCYRAALAASPRPEHRHRIEHCMIVDEPLSRTIKQLGIVPVLQPDIHRLGDGYITALGKERASEVIPMELFKRLAIPVAFSSDAPVIPCNPLEVIRSAMERRTPSGVALGPHHIVSAMEAIRCYTAGSAYATHTDMKKGRLRTGMFADFVVLSRDPATTSIDQWGDVRVVRTVTGGRVVFAA